MTSEFVFFSSNPSLNRIKIEKCLLLFATNANIFTLLFKELETDGKSFICAVCCLTYDHVTSNLISLMAGFSSIIQTKKVGEQQHFNLINGKLVYCIHGESIFLGQNYPEDGF